jgi:hypothetical protein
MVNFLITIFFRHQPPHDIEDSETSMEVSAEKL